MKKFLSIVMALLAVICVFGLIGCNDADTAKYTLSVTCGANGSYEITKEGEVEENTSVTLTVKSDDGYEVDFVTVNDSKVNLTDNKYTFSVKSDARIVIAFKAAEDEDPYSVSVSYAYSGDGEYDETMGLAVISPQKDKYDNGDRIVLTVTAGRGYEVDFVTVNGKKATLAMGTTNSYRIEVTGKTEIVVTFKDGEREVDPNNLWAREWRSLDESVFLSVTNENEATLTIDGAEIEIDKVELSQSFLSLTGADLRRYEFGWYDGIVRNKIVTYNDGSSVKLLIPTGKTEIDEDFDGTWYNYYGEGSFTVDSETDTATINGKNATVVDCGNIYYDPTYNFDLHDPDDSEDKPMIINHECYYFVVSDSLVYFIGWYKDDTQSGAEYGRVYNGPTVSNKDTLYEPYIDEIYIDPMLQGAWRTFSNPEIKIDVSVSDKTIKVDGQQVTAFNRGATKGSGNIIRIGNKDYSLTPYDIYIMREDISGSGMGIGKRDYFLRSDKQPVNITQAELLGTEWQDIYRTHSLSIDQNGNLTYDGVTYYIFTAGMLDNGYYQAVAFSAANLNINLTYLPRNPNSLTVDNGVSVSNFVKKTGESAEVKPGFLGLAMGTYYDTAGGTYSVEIKEDRIIIDATLSGLAAVEGSQLFIEVTEDMLVEEQTPIYESSKHYSFIWTDVDNNIFFKKCHIALDVKYKPVVGEEEEREYKLMFSIGEYDDRFFNLPEAPAKETSGAKINNGETAFVEEKSIR